MMKSSLGFGDLDQIFKVTAGLRLPNLSQKVLVCTTGSNSSVGRVSTPGNGRYGFDPGPRHTKVVKNVLAAPRLALRLTG